MVIHKTILLFRMKTGNISRYMESRAALHRYTATKNGMMLNQYT